MTLRRVLDPQELPLTFEEAVRHLHFEGITGPGHEERITECIVDATAYAERYTGRALVRQTWEKRLDAFPADGGAVELEKPPVSAIVSVVFVDADGEQRTLDPQCYELDPQSETAWLVPAYGFVWPETQDQPQAAVVTFEAGWAAPGVVPGDIKRAIRMLVGHFYRNTDAVTDRTYTEVPMGVHLLLEPWRLLSFV